MFYISLSINFYLYLPLTWWCLDFIWYCLRLGLCYVNSLQVLRYEKEHLVITMNIYVAIFLSLWQTLSGHLFWERDKRTGENASANFTWRTGKVWGAKSSPFLSCCKSCLCACTFHTLCGERLHSSLYLSQIGYLGIQDKGINQFFCRKSNPWYKWIWVLKWKIEAKFFKMQFISILALHINREQ